MKGVDSAPKNFYGKKVLELFYDPHLGTLIDGDVTKTNIAELKSLIEENTTTSTFTASSAPLVTPSSSPPLVTFSSPPAVQFFAIRWNDENGSLIKNNLAPQISNLVGVPCNIDSNISIQDPNVYLYFVSEQLFPKLKTDKEVEYLQKWKTRGNDELFVVNWKGYLK